MKNIDIARAMKDASYRQTLSAEQRALVGNPAGELLFSDAGPGPDILRSENCEAACRSLFSGKPVCCC